VIRVFLLCGFLCGCVASYDEELIRGSMAIVHAAPSRGSGVHIGGGIVATACHVIDDALGNGGRIWLEGLDGKRSESNAAHCAGGDLAFVHASDPSIFGDEMQVVDLADGLGRGCMYGAPGPSDQLIEVCSPFSSGDNRVMFLGRSVLHGMSGGPCVAGDGYAVVVGVISRVWYRQGHENELGVGRTLCVPVDMSKIRKVGP
jgi:hypothetical protein